MAEEDTVFSSKIKYGGIFSFDDFYVFAYKWLTEELGLIMGEDKYTEKLEGDAKKIEIKWSGFKNMTDYFRFNIKVEFLIIGLKKVEITQNGEKVKTNSGTIEIKAKGILTRDYKGKFELNAFNKFLRSIYEKWIIESRVEEFQGKVGSGCEEFLEQSKAYFDLEGKKG
jgi:hypothetical protein